MELLVATRSFLAQLSLDARWEVADFQVLARGRHYGIALPDHDAKRALVMAKYEDVVIDYRRGADGAPRRYSERDRISLSGPFDDTHQVAYCEGGLYIANSGYNSLDFVPLDGAHPQRLFFDEHGSRHVNSVYPCGSATALAMLHNKGTKRSEIAVVRRDPERGLELVNMQPGWDMGCHNVYVDDDVLAYNASEIGDFVVVGVHDGRPIRRIHFPGHTKGLSVTRDHYLIGVSEYASRWARNTSRGYLVAINRRTLRIEAQIDVNHRSLPHPIGNINELRCISEPEHGHAGEPTVDLERLRLDPGAPTEQLRLRTRRAFITGLKTAKTLLISARERGRRVVRKDIPRAGLF